MNTQDQKRAQQAFACVNSVATSASDEFKKKYSTQCRRLPQLIQQCGLCQTVAFLSSKPTDDTFKRALGDFAVVVSASGGGTGNSAAALAESTRTLAVRDYQWLSRHALQCATWMKRYAEALLPKEEQ